MKNLLGLFLIIAVISTSCDGRKSQSEALTESIKEFSEKVTLQKDVYKPNDYIERQTDTLLSNGFRVKIKAYTDLNNSVVFTHIKDTINYNTYYRNFKIDISVSKNNKVIFNESIDKQKAIKFFNYKSTLLPDAEFYNFDKLAVLKSVEVNADPVNTNVVAIEFLYAIPESERFASHTLIIDETGKSTILPVEAK